MYIQLDNDTMFSNSSIIEKSSTSIVCKISIKDNNTSIDEVTSTFDKSINGCIGLYDDDDNVIHSYYGYTLVKEIVKDSDGVYINIEIERQSVDDCINELYGILHDVRVTVKSMQMSLLDSEYSNNSTFMTLILSKLTGGE